MQMRVKKRKQIKKQRRKWSSFGTMDYKIRPSYNGVAEFCCSTVGNTRNLSNRDLIVL